MQNPPLFKGRKLVIATKHEKERVIAPLLEKFLGVEIVVPEQFDSDQFGTFTGEIKRTGDQLEAARAKVQAALALTDTDLGVASEGSFGAHPSTPFMQSNSELLLLVDKKNGYEICGHYRTPTTNVDGQYVTSVDEALSFGRKIGFPEHGVIVRRSQHGRFGIDKNIQTEAALIETVSRMLSRPLTKRVFVESDLRAHRNPTRMTAIAKATEDLIKNIASVCPQCQAPGFVVVDFEKGLKCSLCDQPTDLPLNNIYRCHTCDYEERRPVTKYGKKADPRYCEHCNP